MYIYSIWFTWVVNAHEVKVFVEKYIVHEMQDGRWRVNDKRVAVTHWRHECTSKHDTVQSLYGYVVRAIIKKDVCGSSLRNNDITGLKN